MNIPVRSKGNALRQQDIGVPAVFDPAFQDQIRWQFLRIFATRSDYKADKK
jgi:hypothetical protein